MPASRPISTPPGMGFAPFAQKSIANPKLSVVVDWMVKFAHQGKADPRIRALVAEICKEVTPGDYASEVLALYYWVCANIRYMRDPTEVEYVQDPINTIKARSGDCDDEACLLAAMLMNCGNTCSFVVASFTNPPAPTHVFVQVDTPKGPVPLDPVANRESKRMVQTMTSSLVIPLGGTSDHGAGIGAADSHPTAASGGMVFSVYDYAARQFNYYEAPVQAPATGWFRAPNVAGKLRGCPEVLAVALPAHAVHIGYGRVPRGTMATTGGDLGRVPAGMISAAAAGLGEWVVMEPEGLATAALAIGAAYAAYKITTSPKAPRGRSRRRK